jgi:hypothetical protein
MSLPYKINRRVILSEESEFKSLYNWSLQELDTDGIPIGSPQIPWTWRLSFYASELRYHNNVQFKQSIKNLEYAEQDQTILKDKSSEPSSIDGSERISGTLKPASRPREMGRYSMFGTDRVITEFDLQIRRVSEGGREVASLWGGLSYTTDWDFEDVTENDIVQINITLGEVRFRKLVDLMESGNTETLWVQLNQVSGFYSEWSPSIRTSKIKILANLKDQKVEIPAGCLINPPQLGFVAECDIGFTTLNKFAPRTSDNQIEPLNSFEEIEPQIKTESDFHQISLASAKLLTESRAMLQKMIIPLWCIFVVLIWIALKK